MIIVVDIKRKNLQGRMRNKRMRILILIFVLFTNQIYGQSDHSENRDQAQLELLLKKCAEYCERVKSIALLYVCQEEIQEKTNFYRIADTLRTTPYGITEIVPGESLKLKRTRTSSYLYDFQLMKKEEKLNEQRILLEKNKRKKHIENAELEVRFNAAYLIYGSVGFLSQYWQNDFEYKIIGQEDIDKIPAAIIKATPKPNNKENRNFAEIWINEKDGSILQIEWEPESIIDYKGKNIELPVGNFKTVVVWKVTYGVEKNGVRFPGRQHIQEFLVSESGKRYLRNEIITSFNDYKFFIVETEIKY